VSRPKKVVVVDVDEVVASLIPTWVRALRAKHPECPNPIGNPTWDTWDIKDQIPECYHGTLLELLETHEIYEDVQPVQDSLQAVQLLRTLGCRVVFATSVVVGHAGAKLRWLVKHGFLETERHCYDYVETSDKALIRGDLLIDDRPKNCQKFLRANGPTSALLFMPRYINFKYRLDFPAAQNWTQAVDFTQALLRL
jgi:5'(3')-deoxyribonucleotidase